MFNLPDILIIAIQIFFVAFFINLLYELLHSVLYTTCLQMSIKEYIPLVLKASTVDGLWISSFYLITYFIFKNTNPLNSYYQIILFFIISILWDYFWEIYSTANKRWEYSENMPLVAGVGLTPLIQLFLTGILSFYIIFNIF